MKEIERVQAPTKALLLASLVVTVLLSHTSAAAPQHDWGTPNFTGRFTATEKLTSFTTSKTRRFYYDIKENALSRIILEPNGRSSGIEIFFDKNEVKLYSYAERINAYTSMTIDEFQEHMKSTKSPEHTPGVSQYYRHLSKKRQRIGKQTTDIQLEGESCFKRTVRQKRKVKESGFTRYCPTLLPTAWLQLIDPGYPKFVKGLPIEFKIDAAKNHAETSNNKLKKAFGDIGKSLNSSKSVLKNAKEMHYKVDMHAKTIPAIADFFKKKKELIYVASLAAIYEMQNNAKNKRLHREKIEAERRSKEREAERRREGKSGSGGIDIFDLF